MEVLKSTIYLREHLFSLAQGYDIEYRALSYKELDNIRSKYSNKTHTLIFNIVKTSLLNKEDISILTYTDLHTLYDNIMYTSILHEDDVDIIKKAVGISLEDSFKDDTFSSCSLCQERRMDINRNCPYLDEKTHDKDVFYIIDNAKVSICPMADMNSPIVNDAFRCYSVAEANQLPTAGGMYDQTSFFVEVSALIKGMINKHTSKELNKK